MHLVLGFPRGDVILVAQHGSDEARLVSSGFLENIFEEGPEEAVEGLEDTVGVLNRFAVPVEEGAGQGA